MDVLGPGGDLFPDFGLVVGGELVRVQKHVVAGVQVAGVVREVVHGLDEVLVAHKAVGGGHFADDAGQVLEEIMSVKGNIGEVGLVDVEKGEGDVIECCRGAS